MGVEREDWRDCRAETRPEWPLFSFGLVSDVQHADIPDGASFHGVPRFYRAALDALDRAMVDFRAQRVDFAMHLGDVSFNSRWGGVIGSRM